MSRLDAQIALAPIPAALDGTINGKLHAETLHILKQSDKDKQAAALQFIAYASSGQALEEMAEILGGMPADLSLQDDYFETHLRQRDLNLNWQVMIDSQAYVDNPSHEAPLPADDATQDVVEDYRRMLRTNPDLDIDSWAADMLLELADTAAMEE